MAKALDLEVIRHAIKDNRIIVTLMLRLHSSQFKLHPLPFTLAILPAGI